MKGDATDALNLGELRPLATLMQGYAHPAHRDWQRLCWLLDMRLADVIRRASEPTIAAIRLAWWDAVLVEGDRSKGGGEPLVEAWRATACDESTALTERLIDGWRTLIGPEELGPADLTDFAEKRGGAFFQLLSLPIGGGEGDPLLSKAGALWALWDLAAHSNDPARAQSALATARSLGNEAKSLPRGAAPKPVRLLDDLARRDIRSGHIPRSSLELRHYFRLVWRGLFT